MSTSSLAARLKAARELKKARKRPSNFLLAKRDPNARRHRVTAAAAKKLRTDAPPRQEEEQSAQVKKLDKRDRFDRDRPNKPNKRASSRQAGQGKKASLARFYRTLFDGADQGCLHLYDVPDGADFDKIGPGGSTALCSAAYRGYVDIVKALLDKGADADKARTDDGSTPLVMAAFNGHVDVVKALLDKGADALLWAAARAKIVIPP